MTIHASSLSDVDAAHADMPAHGQVQFQAQVVDHHLLCHPLAVKPNCNEIALPLHRINGFTHLNLTKLDVLSKLETIRLGTGYLHNGQVGLTMAM